MDRTAKENYLLESLPKFAEHLPSMNELIGGKQGALESLASIAEDSVTWNGLRIHLDIYESSPDDPVIIFHGGIANYARFYYLFLSLLCRQGFNIIAVDRPGHGFSEGKTGDCTVDDVAGFIPLVIEKAKTRFNDKIGMLGSSLGGITTFYLLPDLEGVRSVCCHNWLYPGESPDKSRKTIERILRLLNLFVPQKSIPIRMLIKKENVDQLSDNSYLVDYFREIENDPVYCQSLTLRSIVSYFGGYRPTNSYSGVNIPALGLIAEGETVLPFQESLQWWKRAGFAEENIKVIPGAKHMIFHDRINESLRLVADWFHKTLD